MICTLRRAARRFKRQRSGAVVPARTVQRTVAALEHSASAVKKSAETGTAAHSSLKHGHFTTLYVRVHRLLAGWGLTKIGKWSDPWESGARFHS